MGYLFQDLESAAERFFKFAASGFAIDGGVALLEKGFVPGNDSLTLQTGLASALRSSKKTLPSHHMTFGVAIELQQCVDGTHGEITNATKKEGILKAILTTIWTSCLTGEPAIDNARQSMETTLPHAK